MLFDTRLSLWRYCLWAFVFTFVPAIFLSAVSHFTLAHFHLETTVRYPVQANAMDAFGTLVFAPVGETLLLGLGLKVLSKFIKSARAVAIVSALFWGWMHASMGLVKFLPTSWGFWIFSWAYLVWRKESFREAFLAAMLPHFLLNATVMLGVGVGVNFALSLTLSQREREVTMLGASL